MDQVKVVAFVGMPGAGKSSCVKHLEQMGFPSVYFGGITVDEVKARGLEVNEANEKKVREDIRAKEGKAAYAKRIITKIGDLAGQGQLRVVVDGVYSWTEYKTFEEKFGSNVVFVAITAARHLRHDRLARRPIRPLSEAESTSREYAEIENLEKGGPIANADYTVVNDDTTEQMLTRVDEILKETAFI